MPRFYRPENRAPKIIIKYHRPIIREKKTHLGWEIYDISFAPKRQSDIHRLTWKRYSEVLSKKFASSWVGMRFNLGQIERERTTMMMIRRWTCRVEKYFRERTRRGSGAATGRRKLATNASASAGQYRRGSAGTRFRGSSKYSHLHMVEGRRLWCTQTHSRTFFAR